MKAILFVDDHEMLAQVCCEILEMHGFRAVSAHNGQQAMEKFAQEKFDAVVTDLRMEEMDGLELAQRLRQQHPDLPVILITGYDPVAANCDVVTCLRKQELFPALVDQLKLALGEPEPAECDLKSA